MKPRRKLIVAVGAALLATPLLARAQPQRPLRRIGLLELGTVPAEPMQWPPALMQGLRDLGWIEGQNILIERRSGGDKPELLPALAAELVRLDLEVIVTFGTPAALAVSKATSTIPIVTAVIGNPVRPGLAASLARPGGNVTGNTLIETELRDKRLQLLKELLPGATRIGVLINTTNPAVRPASEREDDEIVRGLGLQLIFVEVRDPAALDQAFAELARRRVQALYVPLDSLFLFHRERVMDLALRHALPTMAVGKPSVEAGALLSYAASNEALLRNAAVFVDKILKGAKPGDLPIERPTRFELIFNLKTAKALGITIAPSLLLRADEVIE